MQQKSRAFCEEKKLTYHAVKQGYAKCSTVLVNEQACITADTSIAAAVKQCGLDVLQIRPGFVELPGYPYGFLGGGKRKTFPGCVGLCGEIWTRTRMRKPFVDFFSIIMSLRFPCRKVLCWIWVEFFRSGKRHREKKGA